MDVWLSKVLLQWRLHITHALILILKYILYITALFICILGEHLNNWVSLSMVLVYKTVFLKPIVRKVGIIHKFFMTFGTVLLKVKHCFNFIFIHISLNAIMCVCNTFQTRNPIISCHRYQPESLQLFNMTTSAFRQPVFVYRSEKCMYSRLWVVRWIWVHVSLPLYCCRHICKQILYNSYKVFCTRNKWIHHERAVSFAYSFKKNKRDKNCIRQKG